MEYYLVTWTDGSQAVVTWEILEYWLTELPGEIASYEVYEPEPEPEPPPETFYLSIIVPSWALGGYVLPGSGDYPAYSTVKLTAHPVSGYRFTGWGGDASGTSLTYNLYMNSDKYVEAYFEKVPTYHLDIFVPPYAAGGYVEPGSGDYPANTTITLRAYPLSGYKFTAWGGDASGTSLTYNLYMDSDKYVEAYFEKVPVPEFAGTISKKELDYDGARSIIPVY